jgi:hypothetical protein
MLYYQRATKRSLMDSVCRKLECIEDDRDEGGSRIKGCDSKELVRFANEGDDFVDIDNNFVDIGECPSKRYGNPFHDEREMEDIRVDDLEGSKDASGSVIAKNSLATLTESQALTGDGITESRTLLDDLFEEGEWKITRATTNTARSKPFTRFRRNSNCFRSTGNSLNRSADIASEHEQNSNTTLRRKTSIKELKFSILGKMNPTKNSVDDTKEHRLSGGSKNTSSSKLQVSMSGIKKWTARLVRLLTGGGRNRAY